MDIIHHFLCTIELPWTNLFLQDCTLPMSLDKLEKFDKLERIIHESATLPCAPFHSGRHFKFCQKFDSDLHRRHYLIVEFVFYVLIKHIMLKTVQESSIVS